MLIIIGKNADSATHASKSQLKQEHGLVTLTRPSTFGRRHLLEIGSGRQISNFVISSPRSPEVKIIPKYCGKGEQTFLNGPEPQKREDCALIKPISILDA